MSDRIDRRRFLELAGLGALAVTGGGLLAGCGDAKSSSGPGTTNQSQLQKLLPAYVPSSSVQPDIPSVQGTNGFFSAPAFLSYPANPVATVTGVPGKGGSYVAKTPLWGAIPASSGNTYYDAVNAGARGHVKMQPADGINYDKVLPTLFAGDKLPDWIQIPSWNMRQPRLRPTRSPSSPTSAPTWPATPSRRTRTWPPSRPAPGSAASGTASSTACRSTSAGPTRAAPSSTARTSSPSTASTPHDQDRRPT